MKNINAKILLFSIIVLLSMVNRASAQVLYVFENERLDEEIQLSNRIILPSADCDTNQLITDITKCITKVSASHDSKKATTSLARLYMLSQNLRYPSGMSRCIQILEFIADRYHIPGAYLQARILQANTAYARGKIKEAYDLYLDAEKYLVPMDCLSEECMLYLNMGVMLGLYGDHDLCIKYILKAVYIVDELIRNPKLHSEAYYRAALIYMVTGDYETAKIYIHYATKICEREGFYGLEAKCHLLMGDYYRKRKELPMYTLSYCEYDKVIGILEARGMDNDYILAKAYNGMGIAQVAQNNQDDGIRLMRKALEMRLEMGKDHEITESYLSLGRYYNDYVKNSDSAQYYFEKAFWSAFECRNSVFLVQACEPLAFIMRKQKNWERAYKYEQLAYSSYKTMSEAQNNRTIRSGELSVTIERERRQNNLVLQKEQTVLYMAFVICIVMLLSVIVVSILLLKKKRKNRQLRKQKEELHQQKEELHQQKEVLAKQNAELEKLSLVARQTDNSIFLTDADGNIIWLNEAFTRHSGYDINDYLNQNDNSLLKASSNTDIVSVMDRIRETKEPVTYTSQTHNKSGEDVWIQTTLSPSLDDNGDISMFIAVCSDITELKHAEEKIAVQNKEINESLEYARKIQEAIQAPKLFVDYVLGDYFVLNMPKNIVSGDFHWVAFRNNKTLFSLADCTGHGIPGGFMSMLEQVMLNNVLQDMDDFTSAGILNKLRERNIKLLHQRGRSIDSQDGMDASLFVFDRDKMELNYAAGYSIAYLVRFGKPDPDTIARAGQYKCPIMESADGSAYLIKLKPNRFPVGGHPKDHIPFTDMFFKVNDGDIVYTSSDGYVDQFGGPDGKKFSTLAFERTILQVCRMPMEEQQEIFERNFEDWRGEHEQTDDVHVFATKLKNNF